MAALIWGELEQILQSCELAYPLFSFTGEVWSYDFLILCVCVHLTAKWSVCVRSNEFHWQGGQWFGGHADPGPSSLPVSVSLCVWVFVSVCVSVCLCVSVCVSGGLPVGAPTFKQLSWPDNSRCIFEQFFLQDTGLVSLEGHPPLPSCAMRKCRKNPRVCGSRNVRHREWLSTCYTWPAPQRHRTT